MSIYLGRSGLVWMHGNDMDRNSLFFDKTILFIYYVRLYVFVWLIIFVCILSGISGIWLKKGILVFLD